MKGKAIAHLNEARACLEAILASNPSKDDAFTVADAIEDIGSVLVALEDM